MFHNLSNSVDDCNGDHDPGVDEDHYVDLSDGYPCEEIDDFDVLDHNFDLDYNDDEFKFDYGLYGVDNATSVHNNLDNDVDDPDFHKSLASINSNYVDDSDDECIHDDQYSHYDADDYRQAVVKSHDMKHSKLLLCNVAYAYKYVCNAYDFIVDQTDHDEFDSETASNCARVARNQLEKEEFLQVCICAQL